ncbi:unnamed protein product [Rotaria magnacalcarata]|uniref:RING-CH-type domain-containing protein n=3 Tax=Rotaria magnacalcarata TaxID=392030 RepID=A0A820GVP0_9BILA|nr:unnamed protein product [Rotaria magnacalcarata]CAF1999402.1 unnamed protein product [Rotaria magnacalcarata]CAF2102195.1 unnamed protein product [Rotaria magnacalcarata]CAF4073199.1 unnamed protein product [Rotaria magnacalcarata]CAF4283669.1 unnamed protein product [Rotaria magnacalcarata]
MACVSLNNHNQIDGTNNNTSTTNNRDDGPLILHKNDQTQVDTSLLPIKTTIKIPLPPTDDQSSDQPLICRLCHSQGTNDELLIPAHDCLGTIHYLHQSCVNNADAKSGECIVYAETEPLKQRQRLNMKAGEVCKLVCSVASSLIIGPCFLWTLYVLIEKMREEVKTGKFQWPFWTKLIIVIIFFLGGLLCLCVQFKMYIKLCIRSRRFNQRSSIRSRHEQENVEELPPRMKYSKKNRDDCIVTIPDGNK